MLFLLVDNDNVNRGEHRVAPDWGVPVVAVSLAAVVLSSLVDYFQPYVFEKAIPIITFPTKHRRILREGL